VLSESASHQIRTLHYEKKPKWLHMMGTFCGGFAIVGGLAEVVGLLAGAATAVLLRHHLRALAPPALAAVCLGRC
jgi:hypothetical protein